MKRYFILIIECLVVFLCGYVICNSEKFQAFIAPEKFWAIKAQALEQKMKILSYKIQSLELSLEKLEHERSFAIRDTMQKAKTFDLNVVNEIAQIEGNYDLKGLAIQEELKQIRTSLLNEKIALQSTYVHLN